MQSHNQLLMISILVFLIFFSRKFPVEAKVSANKIDESSLLSFKSQISKDPFEVLSSWNASIHYCRWQGVTCGRRHPNRVIALVLDSKQLAGFISLSLANLTFLKWLSLSDNQLQGGIPKELGYLNRLKYVNLSVNFLDGSIPSTLGNCSSLEGIVLRSNNFQGIIPSNLVQCTNLRVLDLGNNSLIGEVPSEFGTLSRLSFLSLFTNNLTGSIPQALGNLSGLTHLYLDDNNFVGYIPDSLGKLTNLSQLILSQNELIGSIPDTLGNLTKIVFLHLSLNRLNASIPYTFGNLQNLQTFFVYDNIMSGKIPHSFYNLSALVDLELQRNWFEDNLPSNMCDALPNLQYLYIYDNNFNGAIPTSISNCSALVDIELQSNYFSGTIPSSIGTLQNLQYLYLHENLLEAKRHPDWSFIDALTNCTYLQLLDIGMNQLHGVMPNSIGNIFQLQYLDMSYNKIFGEIPSNLGNLTHMDQLYLNDNAIEGSIPPELGNMQVLGFLNLSNNKLTGKIPKEIMVLSSLSDGLDLSHNYLTDILPPEIGQLENLPSICLSNNKLFGELPSTIGGCQLLEELYLDNNMFNGTIPSTLSNLKGLQILDVANNSFSGQVPEFIGTMNLQYLNISYNNFEGALPKDGIFTNTSGIDVKGNPRLCGGIPKMHLPRCISESPTQIHHSPENIVLVSSVVGSFICLNLVTWLIVTCYCRNMSHNNPKSDRTLKYELKHVSYNDLLRATENFSLANLIGRGTFGTVYKANISFENVKTVAVKVLNLEVHGALRSFFSECETLRDVRHRNLIKVLSLCSGIDHQGNDFKALIFEFMSNGSLATWLHSNMYEDQPFRSLSLIQRLNIANDVASALDYLHNFGPTPIVHCDLKPSNILLDDDMNAHVGDFGLARFLILPDTAISQSMTTTTGIKGSIGYIPPEYGMGGRPSVEGDVYSYGILLLEMITGISPTDVRFGDSLTLQNHVEMVFPEQVMDIVDTKLLSKIFGEDNPYPPENVYNCLVLVIECGLLCSKVSPKERIAIKEVVKELNSARKKLLGP